MSAHRNDEKGLSGGEKKGKEKEDIAQVVGAGDLSASVHAFGNQSMCAQDFDITDGLKGAPAREPKRFQQATEILGGVGMALTLSEGRMEGVEGGEMDRDSVAEGPDARGPEMPGSPSGRAAPAAPPTGAKKRKLVAATQRAAVSGRPDPAPVRPAATKEEVVVLHHLMQQILDQGKSKAAELARLRGEVEILGRQTETTREEAASAKAGMYETLAMVEKVAIRAAKEKEAEEARRVEEEKKIWEHVTAVLGMMGNQVAGLEKGALAEVRELRKGLRQREEEVEDLRARKGRSGPRPGDKGTIAPQPGGPRGSLLGEDSDSDSDAGSEAGPGWSKEDDRELLSGVAEIGAEQSSVGTGEPLDNEMEMEDVPSLTPYGEKDTPPRADRPE